MQALHQETLHAKLFRHPTQPAWLDDPMGTDTIPSAQVVHPVQFYCSPIRSSKTCGEIALMHAVLEDAVDCFRKQFVSRRRRDQRLAREAEEWFLSESDHWPFSFVNICAALELDPEYIRAGLNRWRQYAPTQTTRSVRHTRRARQPLRFAS